MANKTKLELTWIGKENRPRLEPRILLENQEQFYHSAHRVTDHDFFDNRLIFGDNLLAIKALEQEFSGKIKCIFIDPPYNTGAAFEHYDDGLEHSIWLGLMRDRLTCLCQLLAPDGLIFVQIDYREGARLKVLMDEVFGNLCFKNEIIVRRGTKNVQSQFETIDALSTGHDVIYLYAKSSSVRLQKLQALDEEAEPGKWDTFWRGTDRPTMRYEIFGIRPDTGQWRWSEERGYKAKRNFERYCEEYAASLTLDEYYGLKKQEEGVDLDFVRLGPDDTVQYYVSPRNYKILSDVWMDVRTSGKLTNFAHEKHEELLERIVRWSTRLGDWVLDSFAGSGTTGAVAHKMGRRWIMVELGEHCHTHIIPRLKKVIDGEDKGGITEAVGWKGGGGFRYYRLASSLLEQDQFGNPVISKQYNAAMVAEAMCKLMGFTYAPSETIYWQHGHSTEHDFIYVTTQTLTREQLAKLSEEVGEKRSLLICCGAFRVKSDAFPNLMLKKIPKAVLSRCEWGKDDYSLRVENLPKAPPKAGQRELEFDIIKEKPGQ
ncbi:MAG: site-specific DNA-methyltransferase [Nitrospira sp. SB0675_bin_23]|nr:site-specific DNA-methyltransferase [Nitrospira sp. SB0661_bin_20]MYH01574.1 site-specific DNA-methyltransferase [Nitrospira sp. SB0675_bin_23]MYJ21995.1 site-specific DNA-methyltransferase [Nitrospira sp. SB0673_bin_12]